MKVYMMTDLEGVAGVYDWENRQDDSHDNFEKRMRFRRLLTGEVNAAIEGLFEGGATQVIVNDGHGAGYTIDFEAIDPRARVIHGHERPFWLPLLDQSCDATCIVGAHAKARTKNACLCHTMSTAIRDYSVNGVSIGEMGLQALIAGHYGVPFTFVAGDEHACVEMEELIPGVATAPVKTGLSPRSAVALPPDRARALIRERAEASMALVRTIEPLDLGKPIRFREEREEPTFDPEKRSDVWRILDCRTREMEVEDIIDLMHRMYGYPRS
ncbi:MAG: M55 family metallopeptidase [Armatimonadota bacterium]